jgi:hypothetical protein
LSVPIERELADAIRDGAARDAEQRGTGRYRGTVLSTGPLRIDVHALDLTLEPADLTLTRTVGPLTVGDVVVVVEVDEDEWSVLAVERSDDDPEPEEMATQAGLDALAASTDSRLDALEDPEPERIIGAGGQPAFANSWTHFDSPDRPAGFYRHSGHVHLFGLIRGGTIGATAFTLPAGYLPTVAAGKSRVFAVASNDALGIVTVTANGNVTVAVGNNSYASLDGINFRHA